MDPSAIAAFARRMQAVEMQVAILIGIILFAFVISIGLQDDVYVAISVVLALVTLVYALFVVASLKCPNCGAPIDYFGEPVCPKCSCPLVLAATKSAMQWSAELGPEATQRIMDDFGRRKRVLVLVWGSAIALALGASYFAGPRHSPTIRNPLLFAIFLGLALVAGYATFFAYRCPHCQALLGLKYVTGWGGRYLGPNFNILRCPVCGVALTPQGLTLDLDETEN